MPDVSILLPDADAPTGYTVPSTSEIIPKSASAIIDGTSATTAFYPVLEIVSDGGHVVAQSRGSAVAAGGSVEQSWFPGALATGYPETPWVLHEASTATSIGTTVNATYLDMSASDFYTNAASVYSYTTYGWGSASSYGVCKISQSGLYAVTVNGAWGTIETSAVGEVNLASVSLGTVADPTSGWLFGRQATFGVDPFAAIPQGVANDEGQPFSQWILSVPDDTLPSVVGLFGRQYNATVDASLTYGQLMITRIGAAPSGSFYPILPPYT